jgi:hypothetical protein
MATSTICSRTFHPKLESKFRNAFAGLKKGLTKRSGPSPLQAGEVRDSNLIVADNPHLSALARFSNDLMGAWAFIEKLFAANMESLAQTHCEKYSKALNLAVWFSSVFCET